MNNLISTRVQVYDVYERANNTQTKKFKNVIADCLVGVKQAPCYVNALGAIGVACGVASTVTYSFMCAPKFVNGTSVNETATATTATNNGFERYFGCLTSGILGGISVICLAGYTYLSCAKASELEGGELEVGVNEELNKMVVKFGETEVTIELDTPNFIMKMRKEMIAMCKYAMDNDGDVADPLELVKMVCDYLDKIREDDSCNVFVLRHVKEWFENNHFVKYRDYQIKSGMPDPIELKEILDIGSSESLKTEGAEFTFGEQSLIYDDELGTEFVEIPLS